MLSLLKLLASRKFFILFIPIFVMGKELPITQEVEIVVPVGEFSVIEFPFKISAKNITSFMVKQKVVEGKESNQEKKEAVSDLLAEKNKQGPVQKEMPMKTKNISIIQNVNSFTFFPKQEGVMKMVVWGYDHPILLTIKADKKNGFGHYQFILPQSKSEFAAKTEQGSHEETINMLMVHLFNQTLPKGYKSSSKDVSFESNGFLIRSNRELIGKKYLAEEWILTNKDNDDTIIHEESFYEKGIFAISLEDNFIKNSESIRVFVVRTNGGME
ncbi:type-F conjugative transfer system secretin TraK [Sulfurimonas sp.]|uniref:TraK domain-containing protein n=1 Tax=Sulfurimonas sp. TaxID=2022749 RepID=UPI0025D22877|nr:type-F conjugative transfer system secretin TraK [Sulfurimonas sp.]MBW6487564.1 type-F conjugative transfer system secretin TraK [Sulfurimonas sp.]